MGGKSSSLIIWGFLLFMILHFFPRCLATRNLEDIPQINGWNGEQENNNQSKSGVTGSQTKRDASASGESAPADGVVQMPPKSFYRSITTNESSGSETITTNINGVKSNSTKTWNNTQRVVDWNGHRFTTQSPSGQDQSSPPEAEYDAPQAPAEPPIYFPPPQNGPPNSPFNFPAFPPFSRSP